MFVVINSNQLSAGCRSTLSNRLAANIPSAPRP